MIRIVFPLHKNEILSVLFCLPVIFGAAVSTNAQTATESAPQLTPVTALLVRLPTQIRQLQAMQAMIEDPEVAEKTKERLQQRMKSLVAENELQSRLIRTAFEQHFDALPVYFVQDTTRRPEQTSWLDSSLQAAAGVSADRPPFIQLRFGRPRDGGGGPEAMILTDDQLRSLGEPFPRPIQLWTFGYGFNRLLSPETALERLIQSRVSKLNEKLHQVKRELP